MKIAVFVANGSVRTGLVVLLILGAAVGCARRSCEVLLINEASHVGLAQRYFVELLDRVNLVRTTDGDNAHAWRVVIRDAKIARDTGVFNKEFVDYEVISPASNKVNERCFLGLDDCLAGILERLPAQCRLTK